MARTNNQQQMNQNDRDLLIELRTQMGAVRDDIKDLKDNFSVRVSNLEQNAVSKIETTDHENRLRFIERYMWTAIGVLAAVEFYFKYFGH